MARGWLVIDDNDNILDVYSSKEKAAKSIGFDVDDAAWLSEGYDIIEIKLHGFKKKKSKNIIVRGPRIMVDKP